MTNFVSTGASAYSNDTAYKVGKTLKVIPATFAVDASEVTAGDTFELGQVNLADKVIGLVGNIGALTTAADNDLGFYTKDIDGNLVAIDADILWDGVSLASASAYADQLIAKNSSLDVTKTVGDHISKQADEGYPFGIFVVLTMNTAPTADAAVNLKLEVQDGTAQ